MKPGDLVRVKGKHGQVFVGIIIKNAGYTEFLDGTKIQPEAGKLVIFPATWMYVHRGVSPKKETKYICTGWIHKVGDNENGDMQRQMNSQSHQQTM